MNMMNVDKVFEPAKIEVVTFDTEDILTTSNTDVWDKILGSGVDGEDQFFDLMRLINQ